MENLIKKLDELKTEIESLAENAELPTQHMKNIDDLIKLLATMSCWRSDNQLTDEQQTKLEETASALENTVKRLDEFIKALQVREE